MNDLYGIHLESPKTLTISLIAQDVSQQRQDLMDLLAAIQRNIPGQQGRFTLSCEMVNNRHSVLVKAETERWDAYNGPWFTEYALITHDLFCDDLKQVDFVCHFVWGPPNSEVSHSAADTIVQNVHECFAKGLKSLASNEFQGKIVVSA